VPPGAGRYSADLLRLLMSPAAGHTEPLGRRLHPLGVLAMGICLTEGLEAERDAGPAAAQELTPQRLRLRWRKPIPMDATLKASRQPLGEGTWEVSVRDQSGAVICDSQVWVVGRLAAPPDAAPSGTGLTESGVPAGREAVRALGARYEEALRLHRSRRGWRLMLAVQKGYALLREGPGPFVAWLWRAARGRPDLETHDLQFPGAEDDPR
jgi:acyl dehydratase